MHEHRQLVGRHQCGHDKFVAVVVHVVVRLQVELLQALVLLQPCRAAKLRPSNKSDSGLLTACTRQSTNTVVILIMRLDNIP